VQRLTPLKQLLTSIVDYAGLFPPAQLSLPAAMAQYDRAQSSPHRWMLDRFVLPASRLPELITQLACFQTESNDAAHPAVQPWSLSVILSQHWHTDLAQIQRFSEVMTRQGDPIRIDALEVAPLLPEEIPQVCLHLPAVTPFFEIPFEADLAPYLKVLQQTGTAAKLRTGGVASEAFPNSAQLSQRIQAFAQAHIPFKATAGLHHPLPGQYRLTDQLEKPRARMHGFLNVALLAAFAYQQPLGLEAGIAILDASSIASFHFTETSIAWRDRRLSGLDIERSRQQFFRSFGSCSFQEPIADLCQLGLL
jgi:hypothetical protein